MTTHAKATSGAYTDEQLRRGLLAALNGHRIDPDLAWAILKRWTDLNAR